MLNGQQGHYEIPRTVILACGLTALAASWVIAHCFTPITSPERLFGVPSPGDQSTFLQNWTNAIAAVLACDMLLGIILLDRVGMAPALRIITSIHLLLMSLIVVPFTFVPKDIEYEMVGLVALVITVGAICFAKSTAYLPGSLPSTPSWLRNYSWLPKVIVALAAVAFAVYFSCLSLYRCWALLPHYCDMSWENQAVWTALHKWPMWSTVGGSSRSYFALHTPYIYFLVSPLHHLYPTPELLVVLQSLILALGAPLLYVLYRRIHLPNSAAVVFCLAYLLHPTTQGIALFDFHSAPLALPCIFLMWYGLERGSAVLMLGGAIVTLLAREEMAMIVVATGLYGLLAHKGRLWPCVLLFTGVMFFIVNTHWVMPYFGGYSHMGGNVWRFRGLFTELPSIGWEFQYIVTYLISPLKVVQHLTAWPPMEYVVLTSLPLCGLCWLAGWRSWILLAPGLFVTVLSSHLEQQQIGYHYSTMILASTMFTAGMAWTRIGRARVRSRKGTSLLWCIAFTSLCCNYLYGSCLSKHYKLQYTGGWTKPEPQLKDPTRYGRLLFTSSEWPKPSPAWPYLKRAMALIPADASVGVEDPHLHPWFSSRTATYVAHRRKEVKPEFVITRPEGNQALAPLPEYCLVKKTPYFSVYQRVLAATVEGVYEYKVKQPEDELYTESRRLELVTFMSNGDFEEGTLANWHAQGEAYRGQPVRGDTGAARGKPVGMQGEYWIGTYERYGDSVGGTCDSGSFVVNFDILTFLLGGGGVAPRQQVQLVDAETGSVLAAVTPRAYRERMSSQFVDVRRFYGTRCFVRIVDLPGPGYAHINVDNICGLRYPQEK